MKQGIVVRKLKPNDAVTAYALMRSVLPELMHRGLYSRESIGYDLGDYRPRNFVRYIKKKGGVLLGAFEGKTAVGLLLAFSEYGGLINIDWLMVDSNYRRMGIGERLLKRFEMNSRKRKALHRIYTDSEMSNKTAFSFYRKMGYENVATLKDWCFHENRYVWVKKLR